VKLVWPDAHQEQQGVYADRCFRSKQRSVIIMVMQIMQNQGGENWDRPVVLR
jgi:hypothetical protein